MAKKVFNRATGESQKRAPQFKNPRGTAGQIMEDMRRAFNPTDDKVKRAVDEAERVSRVRDEQAKLSGSNRRNA